MGVLTFSVEEYARCLTEQHHVTIRYLHANGVISESEMDDWMTHTVVTPVKNDPSFGQRILNRFFGAKAEKNSYVFVVARIDSIIGGTNRPKPKLKLVDNDSE